MSGAGIARQVCNNFRCCQRPWAHRRGALRLGRKFQPPDLTQRVRIERPHFDLAADELLVETVDTKNRTLQIKVVSPSVAADADELVPTSWRLDGPEPVPLSYCWRSGDFHMQ